MKIPFLSRILRSPHPELASAPPSASTAPEVLGQARALAREGRTSEANELYWKIKRKQLTAEILVEHAELLLGIGDHFSATSKAAAALALEPDNKRALAVQREVTRFDDEEERRRNRS